MIVHFHAHALERLTERGATQEDVIATIQTGKSFAAKFGRTGFRKRFAFHATWRGQFYANKELEVFAVPAEDGWLVITVVTRYD